MSTSVQVALDQNTNIMFLLLFFPHTQTLPPSSMGLRKRRSDGTLLWRKPYIFGSPSVSAIVEGLKQRGFHSLTVNDCYFKFG